MFQRLAILSYAAAGLLSAQSLTADKDTLTFTAQSNGAAVSQSLTISSSASAVPYFLNVVQDSSANNPGNLVWLKPQPVTGATPSTVTISADPAGLPPGVYTATIGVLGGQGAAPSIRVTFNISSIGVTPQSLTFNYQQGGSNPPAQAIGLSGQQTSYTAAASTATGGSWLQISANSGVSPGTLNVTINSSALAGLGVNTYTGKVTITPTSGPVQTPLDVPVTLVVSAAPVVTVSPSPVSINYQLGGANNTPQQTITLSATGNQPVSFSFVNATNDPNPQGKSWVTFSPANGTIPAGGSTTATIGYNDAAPQLGAGTWNGSVTLNSTGQPNQIPIPIKLLIAPNTTPLLNVPTATLAFNYQIGSVAPAAKSVTATSTNVPSSSTTGQMTLSLAANSTGNWLVLPSTTGITGTPFSVTVNPAGLNPGTYNGTVTVAGIGAGNPAQTIPVTLTVANDPQITAAVGGCNTIVQTCPLMFPVQVAQIAPQPQSIKVSSTTGATLNYTATRATTTCNPTWLVLGGTTTGPTEGTFTVTVDPTNIPAGSKCDGAVTITAVNASTNATAPNSPVTIPVTMYVSNTALLSANPLGLNFSAQVQQSSAVPTQTITVNSTSPAEQISFTVTTETANGGSAWLIAGPSTGSTASGSNVVSVLVQPGLLSAGVYSGKVKIAAAGSVANSPIEVPVTLTVTASTLSVSPATLTQFSQTAGGAAPASQTLTVSSNGNAIAWNSTVSTNGTGNWLTVSPASGTATQSSPNTVTVSANGSGLAPGTYNGTITFTSATPFTAGSTITVNAVLVVAPGTISATPASLTFTQFVGSAAPAAQTISVAGTPGSLNYSVTSSTTNGSGWLSVTSSSGTTPGTITVGVNGSLLTPGTYTGNVRILSTGANGSPIDIPVTLTLVSPQTLTVSPTNLTFNHTIGNTAPVAQTVQLQATGGVAPFTITTSVSGGGTWLTVTPSSGTTPSTLAVAVNPSGLAAGNYTGTISVASTVSASPVATSITVNLTVIATVPPAITAVVNAASYLPGPISPGENVLIFGTNVGPGELTQNTATTNFPTTLAETQVTFDGVAAPIHYAWGQQTSILVPYEIAGRPTVTMRVTYKGVQSQPLVLNVAAVAPGLYTQNVSGSGPGAIVNQSGAVNSLASPAPKNSVVAVYMTGEGLTSPLPANGAVAPLNGSGLFRPILPVTATVGGVTASVKYAGSAPGIVYGVMQVNVEIPANAPSGAAVPIQIFVGTTPTQNGVTIAVQ